MTEWVYTARTVAGETRRDEVDLPSREDVIAHLRRQRLVPVSIREKPAEIRFTFGSGISTKDIVVFTRQFATMIDAGVPLVQALEVLARQSESEALRGKVQGVVHQVESGRTLSESLEEHQGTFSRLYVSMVDAGEQGGILDTILERLAEFLEKNEALERKVKGAMLYPAAILSFALLTIIVLLTFVIPTFREMFSQFNQVMPLPTRIVLGISDSFRDNAVWLAAGAGLGGYGLHRWRLTLEGARALDRILLRVPVLGALIQKTAIARFTRTLGTLLGSGVSILPGLEITAATAGSKVVEEAVLDSRHSIARGDTVAGPLERTGMFPPMVTQMIHVGEESGELAGMLHKIADFYDDEVDTAVESLLKVIEPALVVVLGVIVGGMIVAMYLPIFSLITSMGA